MAINFPSNPNNGDTILVGNTTYTFDSTSGAWDAGSSGSAFDGAFSSLTGIPTTLVSTVADMAALIAKTGMTDGDQVFVQANNNLYIYSGIGWYKIATVQNDSPSAISGVDGSYSLAIDGTPTVITAVSSDPEGFPLTWSYSTSGLGSIATVSQADNVFTITPSTNDANIGTFTLTINATDGVNGAVSANTSITLEFIIANSNYTTLLATAVDTSDNNNITDSSSNNHTITVTGDAHAGTFSPYRHGGYSTYFDGSGDWLELTGTALGNGDFTVEAWVWLDSLKDYNVIYDDRATGSSATGLALGVMSTGAPYLYTNNGFQITSSQTCTANTWHHISLVRSSGVITIYLDGTSGGTYSSSANFTDTNLGIGVARTYTVTSQFGGYIRDVRAVVGSAITPASGGPTIPLTAVTNTKLLTCHLPYFKDGSSNAHAITLYGNTSTKPFGPYDYSNVYSTSDNGGSVYFDGTGDYLDVSSPPSLGQNNWTFETWYYPTSSGAIYFMSQGNSDTQGATTFSYNLSTGVYNIQIYITNNYYNWSSPTVDVNNNQWNHVALTHEWNGATGGTYKLYHNGTLIDSDTHLNKFWEYSTIAGKPLGAGVYKWAGAVTNPVYFSDWRLSDSVVYNSNFTPPTAPLSSTGSTLHVKGTDASIIDKSQSSNLQLIGNTTGSTTQVKFADTKSMYFDGTGDYIRIGNNKDTLDGFINNNEIMTVEGWVYPTLSRAGSNIYQSPCILNIGSTYFNLGLNNLTPFFYWWTGAANSFSASNPITLNAWSHIALVLDANTGSNNLKLYVNGNLDGQGTFGGISWASSSQGDEVRIGIGNNADAISYFPGYIQDLRITKGLARYTGNFTPPTVPLKG